MPRAPQVKPAATASAAPTISAQLHSPEDADELLTSLGGPASITEFAKQSQEILSKVKRNVREGVAQSGQDTIYQGMALKNLLAHSAVFKTRFDALCKNLAEHVKKRGYIIEFQAVPVKSFESAQSKVNVDYHGDASRLSDSVRGTIYIKGTPDKDTMRDAYGVLDAVVGASDVLTDADAEFVSLKDRYQNPAGTYRDWLLLVRISGFCCELQINLEAALEIKKKKLHQQYELTRMANRSLLDAAMRGEPKMVRIIVASKCCETDATDAKGFSALHYAARHGSVEMLDALLNTGADPLHYDQMGRLPIYHAALMGHAPAVEQLLGAMEACPQIQLALLADTAKSSLQTSWKLASRQTPDLQERLLDLLAKALSHIDDQSHAAARAGDSNTCKLLFAKGAMKGCMRFQPDVGRTCTALDQAIVSGSIATVKVMLENGITCFNGHAAAPFEKGPHTDFLEAAQDYVRSDRAAQLSALLASVDQAQLPDMGPVVLAAIESRAFNCLGRLRGLGFKAKLTDVAEGSRAAVALHQAAGKNDLDAVSTLLLAGLQPNATDINGRTPLMVAAAGGFLGVMKVLIDAKADVDVMAKDSRTAAFRAGQRGQSRAIELLHEANADLSLGENFPDGMTITPAWIAACNGHIHVIKFLNKTKKGRETITAPAVKNIAADRNPQILEYIESPNVHGQLTADRLHSPVVVVSRAVQQRVTALVITA